MDLCRLCLKTKKIRTIGGSATASFFSNLGLEFIQSTAKICLWCKAAIQKCMLLIKIAKITDNILSNIKRGETFVYNNEYNEIHKTLFSLSISKTKHINISDDDSDGSNDIIIIKHCEKGSRKPKTQVPDKNIDENDRNESYGITTEGIEHSNCVKEALDSDDIQFDVKYLTDEEQHKEIDGRRNSEAYVSKKFRCELCGVGFLTHDVFESHRERHDQKFGEHECRICTLRFKTSQVMTQHMLSHSRRLECRVCLSRFTRWSLCRRHRKVCGGYCIVDERDISLKRIKRFKINEKRYKCQECDKQFMQKHKLTVHLRTHTGEKPFACTTCNASFATNSNLKSHQNSVHTTTREFYCVECDTYYKTDKGMKRHLRESPRHSGENGHSRLPNRKRSSLH